MLENQTIKDHAIICPVCRSRKLDLKDQGKEQVLNCTACGKEYPVFKGIPLMLVQSSEDFGIKKDIQEFWKELYHAAYSGHEQIDANTNLPKQLDGLKELFSARRHLAVVEMPIEHLKDKEVLEIGSGAGAHSALFCKAGAKMTALDLTLDRVVSTRNKLSLIDEVQSSYVVQGDAEHLPFEDNYFDIVYSNGVLHHTPDTLRTIQEVYRVLKPGGRAIIMLYAKHSYLYWVNIFLLRGVILGNLFRHSNWLGRTTEWMSNSKQKIYNPETKVYSRAGINQLFYEFENIHIRKSSFVFQQIPYFGKVISWVLSKVSTVNPSGVLIYNHAWRHETKLELLLGRYIGFNLNITATKKNK
jgi:ubiquinone/menaquinone biosynthesis C-methylase UbiE/uncharacterized protein YbaR (Trm112 family)